MGLRSALLAVLLLSPGPVLVGCGGGAPLAEAEKHLAAGRLERAAGLLEAHSGPAVEKLRVRIAARADERARALARIDEIQRGRDGREPREVLAELQAVVVDAEDPFVREHAEVALSTAYDWAAEQRAAQLPTAGSPPTSTRVSPRDTAPKDSLAAAALGEFERHVASKDWRSALGVTQRWTDNAGVDATVRASFDARRAAALDEATREADALVVRAWRLDEGGDRAGAVALLSAAVDRFPTGDDVAAGSPVGGVARALAELQGYSSFQPLGADDATANGALADATQPSGTSTSGTGTSGAGTAGDARPGDPAAAPRAGGADAGSVAGGAQAASERSTVAAADGAKRGGEGSAEHPPAGDEHGGEGRHGAGARDAAGAGSAPGAGSRGDGSGLPGGAVAGGGAGGNAGRGGRSVTTEVGAESREQLRARFAAAHDALVQARTPLERDAAFATLFAATKSSFVGREVLAEALTARFERAVVRLDRLGSLKRLERVAEQRRALDVARERALGLIFDETRYFYPYNTPAVSAEQAAKYPAVQREVDALVAAVREVWEGSSRARIPDPLRTELPELAWLRRRAPLVPGGFALPEKYPAWLEALPYDLDEVDLRSFAWKLDEARDLARNRAIQARNEQLWSELDAQRATGDQVPTAEERQQVRITNEYRAMMGRRALAWHPALNTAARGHSVYMNTTGQFGHHEPTPDRHSPFDRMRLVGYTRGVSENCHMGSADAEGAHRGWLGSSGHHRNLLMAGHREMASAVAGGYWTQNFGLDTSFEQHLDLRGWRD